MRFINIWFRFRPGGREEFLAFFRPLVPWIRAREGVLYFELGARDEDETMLIVSECFATDADHAAMWATPEFERVGKALDRLVIGRRADNHYSDAVRTQQRGDIETFGPPLPQLPPV